MIAGVTSDYCLAGAAEKSRLQARTSVGEGDCNYSTRFTYIVEKNEDNTSAADKQLDRANKRTVECGEGGPTPTYSSTQQHSSSK